MQLKALNDPVLIWGALISVALGVLAYFLAKDVAGSLGIVVGLEGLAITMLIQVIGTDAGARDLATRQSRLFGRAEKIAWLPQWLDEASKSLDEVTTKYPGSPADDEAQRILGETLTTLRSLALGQIAGEFGDLNLILSRTAKATSSLRATAIQTIDERTGTTPDESWWTTGRARTYWAAQKKAMERNVSIERIFVYHDWSQTLDEIAKEQQAAGVVVYRVRDDALPRGVAKDLILWDQNCVFETRFEGDGTTEKNCFTVDPVDIKRLQNEYDKVRSHAEAL